MDNKPGKRKDVLEVRQMTKNSATINQVQTKQPQTEKLIIDLMLAKAISVCVKQVYTYCRRKNLVLN